MQFTGLPVSLRSSTQPTTSISLIFVDTPPRSVLTKASMPFDPLFTSKMKLKEQAPPNKWWRDGPRWPRNGGARDQQKLKKINRH